MESAGNRVRDTREDGSIGPTGEAGRRCACPERGAFLAEASRLLAQSLDYETTLAAVARLAMPELGAWCIVDVLGEGGGMERIAVIHPDPGRQALARRLALEYPPARDDIIGVPRAMVTRRPELVPSVTDAMLAAVARSPEHLAVLRELGMGSFMVLPLVARDHLLGCITFVSASEQRRYDATDLRMAEDLANRAALALDNAQLYRAAERARGAAEAAAVAKSEFVATMSHELRTPLNAILGYLDLMELGLSGAVTELQRAQLARIRECGTHLTDLVGQVLDLADVEAARLPLDLEPGELSLAVEAALAVARPHAAARSVRLAVRCGGGADAGYVADHGRTRQIVVHLLSNAVKFTPVGGRVDVVCGTVPAHAAPLALTPAATTSDDEEEEAARRWAYVQVRDTGPGIAPADAERIFGPFVQLDQSRTRASGGSGLGLTLARQLARLMGGDVTVESVAGRGSVFTLWLPAAPVASPGASAPARLPAEGGESRGAAPGDAGGGSDAATAAATGRRLLDRLDRVMERYVARVRAEEPAPQVLVMTELEILDHAASLLTDVAHTLIASAAAPDEPSRLVSDGAEIQRVIAEHHGAQRRRLGWSEAAVRRDFAILRAAVADVLGAPSSPGGAGAAEGSPALDRLLARAEHESVRAYRRARVEADGGG